MTSAGAARLTRRRAGRSTSPQVSNLCSVLSVVGSSVFGMATATIERFGGGGTSSVDPFAACLRIMGAALADVVHAPAWSLTDEALTDRIAATLAVSAGVDELLARLVGSALERELARLAGASSPTAWLACNHGLSRGAAAGIVASAQAVNDTVPATRVAWSKGQLTTEQAVLIAETVTGLGTTVDLAARAEAEVYLIDQAPRFTFTQLRHLTNHVVEVVDPDGADGPWVQASQAVGDDAPASRASSRSRADPTSRANSSSTPADTAKVAVIRSVSAASVNDHAGASTTSANAACMVCRLRANGSTDEVPPPPPDRSIVAVAIPTH